MSGEEGPAAVFVAEEGDAAAIVGGVAAAAGQNGGGFVRPSAKAAAALTAEGWADARPLSEQLSSYPATCLLAAIFVTVRRREEGPRRPACC